MKSVSMSSSATMHLNGAIREMFDFNLTFVYMSDQSTRIFFFFFFCLLIFITFLSASNTK